MDEKLEKMKKMDRAGILSVSFSTTGDFELLDLAEYFREEMEDDDREMAVIELALRSPLNDEMVAYEDLYHDLINYYSRKEGFPAMTRWAVAHIAYEEQNEAVPLNLLNVWRGLAEAYLYAGDFKSGLNIFARLITRYPGDIWNYNALGMILPGCGLNELALAVVDRGLALVAKKDPQNLRKQFRDFQREAQANLANSQERTDAVGSEGVQALRAAIALPGAQSPDEDAELTHLAPLDRLIALDRQGDRSLDAEILNHGRVLIPELIHLGMDSELAKETLGPWHAARLLNELRAGVAPELEILGNWLDRTGAEDWQPWISAGMFGKIGGYTFEELEAFVRDPQFGDIYREAALNELVERANQQPLLRSKLIVLLRELLNRENSDQASEETFTAFLISDAVDLKAQELVPEIQRAFNEDRVDKQIIDEAFAYSALGLPVPPIAPRRTDGLYLRVECAACGRTREQFTRFVLMDQTVLDAEDRSGRSPYILDHEFVCPKCGAVEQYRLHPMEIMKLMQADPLQMAAMLLNQTPAKLPKLGPRVYVVQGEAFGRPMHPLDTVDEYRRRIARDPKNGELYMRLGNTLRFIGRYETALAAYRQAVELAPDDPEVLIPVATAEHDFGDLETARQLYERCAKQGKEGDVNENIVTALQGLRALNRGEMSPWEYQVQNADGQRLMPPNRQQRAQLMKEDRQAPRAKKDKRAKRHKKRKDTG